MRTLSAIVGLVMVLAGCTQEDSGCKRDTDCKGNRVCERGACVEPKTAASAAVTPTPTPEAPASPAPAPRPVAPRETCAQCGEDCLDKADRAKRTDAAWATHLASQYCNETCGYPGAVSLRRCHNYGFLLKYETPRR